MPDRWELHGEPPTRSLTRRHFIRPDRNTVATGAASSRRTGRVGGKCIRRAYPSLMGVYLQKGSIRSPVVRRPGTSGHAPRVLLIKQNPISRAKLVSPAGPVNGEEQRRGKPPQNRHPILRILPGGRLRPRRVIAQSRTKGPRWPTHGEPVGFPGGRIPHRFVMSSSARVVDIINTGIADVAN